MVLDLQGFAKLLGLSFGLLYLRMCLTSVNKDIHKATVNFPQFTI